MGTSKRQQILENLIYIVIWLILLVTPFIDYVYRQNRTLDWNLVLRAWVMMLPFFIIFLINNFLLMPRLLIKKKSWLYLLATLLTICAVLLLFPHREHRRMANLGSPEQKEWMMNRQKFNDRMQSPDAGPTDTLRPINDTDARPNDTDAHFANEVGPANDDRPALDTDGRLPNTLHQNKKDFRPGDTFGPENDFPGGPPRKEFLRLPFMLPFFNNFIIAVLLVGFNIAVKLLFQSIRDEHQLKEFEKHNLQTELAYLKHQINPHFFMNTLNNIHALIDLDTEKAKETVIELSKMMRYVLYDSSQATISLEKEIQFLNNYIDLMKLRYTDKVSINLSLPEVVPSVKIPPLLFISFLENAFKHGISYQQESYVNFSLQVDEKEIQCLVSNSNCDQVTRQQGIGLENVRKRLNLLYPDNYTLEIDSTEKEYNVLLIIPII